MAVWNQELRYYICSPSQLSLMGNGFAYFPAYCLDADIQYRAYPILPASPIAQMVRRWYRNINLLSIAYAFRPRLRSRLTLSGRAFLRKPWAFGGGGFSPLFRYSYRHSHFKRSTSPSGLASQPLERSPTTVRRTVRSFGDTFSPSTFSAQSHSTSELLHLFKWWLLLSQHPGCLSNSTSFST